MWSIEFCAGAGGQALGLEQAGFEHAALIEIETDYAKTLTLNRPNWDVRAADMNFFDGRPFKGIDLLAAGLPCPPFSMAGKQLGEKDERNLFPAAIRLIDEIRPKAVMIENVRGFLSAVFEDYRGQVKAQLKKLGYTVDWRLLNASDYGVPQLRPRVVIIAIRGDMADAFDWPTAHPHNPATVGETLYDLMAANGWRCARRWANHANEIAPTIVGGSKKHGGPDLGPTRARQAWASLGAKAHRADGCPHSRFP
jgi:DNA (cytosine-5)-methyltransferase 1